MSTQTLYKECPLCKQMAVTQQGESKIYRCDYCHLTLKNRPLLGFLKKNRYAVEQVGEGDYTLAQESLADVMLEPSPLRIALGNVYTDSDLALIANGSIETIRPVQTILAQIILEQLREECFLQVSGLRRGQGPVLEAGGFYLPTELSPRQGLDWKDEGNLFCTTNRVVFPSNQFTFIRMDRKVSGVQAFKDGIAIQRKGEEFATYFVGCYPHEAAVVAAYVMAKVPILRPSA